ncbi:MAG: citrate lyase holo-[acyl-carrier protein] synthase, partial [Negativicutes bacterium]|nr:citrate lyase holo-[acyl-carrier protein] synthase [Negativicutes bacterium]
CLLEERIYHTPAGPAAVVVFQGDAAHMKCLAVALETEEVYGRLLDIDVFTADGRQISRHSLGLPERGCFVCPENAVDCMRAKRH